MPKQKQTIYFLILIFTGFLFLGILSRELEAYGNTEDDAFTFNRNITISHNVKVRENNRVIEPEINPLCDLDVIVCPNEEVKKASWYDYTLNGIEWSKTHRTCASRDLPRYSTAIVTNLENNKSVECFINDYGPEAWTKRDIDLSSYAFSRIADLSLGLADVKIEQK